MGVRLAARATEGSMKIPDLKALVSWWQKFLVPDDKELGNGLADYDITAEYVPNLTLEGLGNVWALLLPPDLENKRAHIQVRTPTNEREAKEVNRSVFHELGHVLAAPLRSTNTAAEENMMHSLDKIGGRLAELDPEYPRIFARIMTTQYKARAYRAEEGSMPDPIEDPKKPDVPKAQEGAPRDVVTIQGDIAKAAMAGQPVDELAKELALALIAAGSGGASAPASEPMPAAMPAMGMQQEQAYARKIAENNKEAIEAVLAANPHLDDKQKAMARKQHSVKDACELIASYHRPATDPAKPTGATMGLDGHPATPEGGGKTLSVRARAMQADPEVKARIQRATSEADTAGLSLDIPGHILAWSPTEMLKEQRHQWEAEQKGRAA